MKCILAFAVLIPILSACAARGPARAEPGSGGDAPPAVDARSIAGVEWRLVELGGQPILVRDGARAPFLRFDAESSMLHGHGGVNSLFGPYALDGAALRVENLASTRMAGPPEAMELERAFAAAIQSARSVRVRGQELHLLDDSGQPLARLVAPDPHF